MEATMEKHIQERAVLVGLNADCFSTEQTATEETLEELDALLETAGGEMLNREDAAKPPYPRFPQLYRRGQGTGSENAGGGYGIHHGDI